MMPVEVDSSRRLALRLHALHASDRAWILSRIDCEARTRLESMLQELDNLGFRIDQETLDSLAGQTPDPESHPAVDTYRQHLELLSKAQPEWMLKHLKGEPSAILDCLATAYAWPWLATLQAADALGTGPVQRGEPQLGPTPRVRQALLAELAQRIMADHPGLERVPPAADTRHQAPDAAGTRNGLGLRRWWPWKR